MRARGLNQVLVGLLQQWTTCLQTECGNSFRVDNELFAMVEHIFLQLVRKNCFFYDWHWTDGWGGGSFGVGVHHTPEHQHVCHVATYIEVQQPYNNAMEQWRVAAEAEEKLAERH